MCPDDALLSAFVDGEVPSPWKERMEAHVAGCAACSRKVRGMRALGESLRSLETGTEAAVLTAAKARIGASIDFGMAGRAAGHSLAARFFDFWSRRIALPMPALAAGLLAIVFFAGLTFGIITPFAKASRLMASASTVISPGSATLEMMAQYMKQSSVQPVMIEMPKESEFCQLGNPVVMTSFDAADQAATTTPAGGASR
ncbi:zf-HC2 domain-containing protein [bacterium]|nr:zf-HC2 domain-containing protein [bacterium]